MKEKTAVFVVSSKFCGDFFVDAAFSTKQQAEDFITQNEMSSGYITELTIDKPSECTEDIPFRAGLKQEQGISQTKKQIENLQKAVFYIQDEIQFLQAKQQEQ